MIRASTLATPLAGAPGLSAEVATGPTIDGARSLRDLGRALVEDRRDLIPVADPEGRVTGVLDRRRALDLILGELA